MGSKVCLFCGGSGGYTRQETVSNPYPGAGPLYTTVSVRERCLTCGGSGSTWEPDPVPVYTSPPPPPVESYADVSSASFGGAGRAPSARGGSAIDEMADGFGALTDWVIKHVWPLGALLEVGRRMVKAKWQTRIWLAGFGAVFGLGSLTSPAGTEPLWRWGGEIVTALAGADAFVLPLAVGAVAGWFLPDIAGMILGLSSGLVAAAIALALVALVVYLGYLLLAAFAGWPPFEQRRPVSLAVAAAPCLTTDRS